MDNIEHEIQKTLDCLGHRKNEEALRIVAEILRGVNPPNRIEISPGRTTLEDWLVLARKNSRGMKVPSYLPR